VLKIFNSLFEHLACLTAGSPFVLWLAAGDAPDGKKSALKGGYWEQ
jgi:hypothetical protein